MSHRLAVLADTGVNGFELAASIEIFGVARPEIVSDWYDLVVCGPATHAIELQGGLTLQLTHGVEWAIEADTVVVPAWTTPRRGYDDSLLNALVTASQRGARIVSLCTGAFVLAAAGLLDARPATTHWQHADLLQHWYPSIDVQSDLLYVDDGNVLTSAGSSAAIDLSIHLVSKDYGSAVASSLARRLVMAPHREGGQAQFVDRPAVTLGEDDPIAAAMSWALGNLDEVIRVRDLARVATTSERTFTRQFQARTGLSPIKWLQHQRVERAKELLETSRLSIPMVAELAGLGSAANFRNHFLRLVGVSPNRYRRSFNGLGH